MNTPRLRIITDQEGHRLSVGDTTFLLNDQEAIQAAAALLSESSPAFEAEKAEVPDPVERPSCPTPADLALPRRAPEPKPRRPRPSGRPDKGVIDVSSMPHSSSEALRVREGKVDFVSDSRRWAEKLSVSDEEIIGICEDPEEEWLSENAEVFYVIGNGVGLTISTYDGAVLAVRKDFHMNRFRLPEREERGTPRGRGGSGRRYPNDADGLRRLLVERGFEVETVGSGHQRVSRDGLSKNISSTPGDHRTVINEIKNIERHFGVSLAKES